MRLSAPIFRLKRYARMLSRNRNIPHNKALNQIAQKEGYKTWSLLMANVSLSKPARVLYQQLEASDLVLLGARPGQGKTMMGLELVVESIVQGHQGVFFTLEYTRQDVYELLDLIGPEHTKYMDQIQFDDSDHICSRYIIDQLENVPQGSVVIIDYLQILDQKRSNLPLEEQVRELKLFAEKNGLIFVFISQIARSFDHTATPFPDYSDIRLPNPVDLSLFNKTCFLNSGKIRIDTKVQNDQAT